MKIFLGRLGRKYLKYLIGCWKCNENNLVFNVIYNVCNVFLILMFKII